MSLDGDNVPDPATQAPAAQYKNTRVARINSEARTHPSSTRATPVMTSAAASPMSTHIEASPLLVLAGNTTTVATPSTRPAKLVSQTCCRTRSNARAKSHRIAADTRFDETPIAN